MNICGKSVFLGLCLLCSLTVVSPSIADTFNWTYTGAADGVTGSGTMTGSSVSGLPATYLITGITGTFDNLAIATLLPTDGNNGSFDDNDNLLFPSQPPSFLDLFGISFSTTNNGPDFNFFDAGSEGCAHAAPLGPVCVDESTLDTSSFSTGTLTVTDTSNVPEPGMISTLLLGLCMLVAVARRFPARRTL